MKQDNTPEMFVVSLPVRKYVVDATDRDHLLRIMSNAESAEFDGYGKDRKVTITRTVTFEDENATIVPLSKYQYRIAKLAGEEGANK